MLFRSGVVFSLCHAYSFALTADAAHYREFVVFESPSSVCRSSCASFCASFIVTQALLSIEFITMLCLNTTPRRDDVNSTSASVNDDVAALCK